MPNPVDERPIEVIDGPTYLREIEQFPHAEEEVQKVLDNIIKPAIKLNPILPHEHGAGTPVIRGVLNIRVPDSSAATGRSGGYRLYYHWNPQARRLTKLTISLRRDRSTLVAKAVDKLVRESGAAGKGRDR